MVGSGLPHDSGWIQEELIEPNRPKWPALLNGASFKHEREFWKSFGQSFEKALRRHWESIEKALRRHWESMSKENTYLMRGEVKTVFRRVNTVCPVYGHMFGGWYWRVPLLNKKEIFLYIRSHHFLHPSSPPSPVAHIPKRGVTAHSLTVLKTFCGRST